ncbi:CaiB/BaiF CoA-transferase family protein [Gordonia sp. LSe1-13]|uniref:CaiB/BaiF CoA-transferase family protein n=1 Tax=Gordonia sesuvii TaxID=3116777 RepID=A0ABU7M8V7_9ACTN|nr:CaiB/BaiF CoA-transferase family protein [Gordonia sp. LSe1-13]
MNNPAGPLAGITVVALEQAVSAPMCTRTLADLGARVIKVENPRGGDFARHYDDVVNGMAAHFVWVNRGKESITLDLKHEAGLDVLHRLLAAADVVVSNLAPGSTRKLGITPADLAQRHPDLIAVEIDGYGAGGPLSHKRAYDLLAQAESGACAITGGPDAPAKPGPPMADVCSGLYSAISILSLLVARGRGESRGGAVAVSLFDTMTDLMGYALNYTGRTGVDQEPRGMGSPAVAPYGAYPTADGQTVVLGTTNDREWQRLATEILQRDDLATDPRFTSNSARVEHRDVLDTVLNEWCSRHDLLDIQKAADDAGIGNARFNRPSDVIAHPHLAERDRWRSVDTPNGPIPAILPPPVIDGFEPRMGAIPGLGEHTDAILAGVGLDPEDIADLRTRGAVGPAFER